MVIDSIRGLDSRVRLTASPLVPLDYLSVTHRPMFSNTDAFSLTAHKEMLFSSKVVVLLLSSCSWMLQGKALVPSVCCQCPSIKSRLLSQTVDEHDFSVRDSWAVLAVGDLHLEDDMASHEQARDDCMDALRKLSIVAAPLGLTGDSAGSLPIVPLRDVVEDLWQKQASELTAAQLEILLTYKREGDKCHSYLVSLGDLGRKDIRHEPGDAGTTKCFQDAKAFLDGFGLPLDVVTGNHDLEGLDEFKSDQENINAFLECFEKDTPNFFRQIGERTILVGLSTVRFRDAPHSSHEVHVDDEQINWFIKTVQAYPDNEGWKIIVFSHAPIMGSGLRVLQSVHVTNGCAWLNHCSPNRNIFIQTVKANPQIKCWASGHFHLSHDYDDSITTVGSCTFMQVGVMGPKSTRDGRRQTRLIQGCPNQIRIFTLNHHIRNENDEADIRLDAEIDLCTGEVNRFQTREVLDHEWFQAYVPREEDGCYIESPDGSIADATSTGSKVCWWHMADGKVLGLHAGQLVEYDAETLSPLGVVVNADLLGGREVVVVQEGTAVVLVDNRTKEMEVIHPNDDGSYWRKFQRNKRLRLEEKAREEVARRWIAQNVEL